MSELGQVLLLALFPAAGNFLGGMIAEAARTSRRQLAIALHFSAGIIFGVISLELAPRAFEGAPAWLAAGAFMLGGASYLLIESSIQRLTRAKAGQSRNAALIGAWVIYAAVAVDLFSDGLLIGTGSAISTKLALLLALGQVTADVPEGFATITNLKDKAIAHRTRLILSASFAVPVLAGALLSFLFLRDQSREIQLAALGYTAGLLLTAAVEEIIGQAHEAAEDTRAATLSISAGFVLFGVGSTLFNA